MSTQRPVKLTTNDASATQPSVTHRIEETIFLGCGLDGVVIVTVGSTEFDG